MEERIPTHLKHKPVVAVENYRDVDGRTAYRSDVRGLSIGLAQWNSHATLDASAKVWRFSGERWSRLSEELPIHRLLDLAILFLRTRQYFADSYRFEKGYDEAHPVIDRIGLQGDAMTVEICTDNEFIDDDVQLLLTALAKDDELISERLSIMARLLDEMGYVSRPRQKQE